MPRAASRAPVINALVESCDPRTAMSPEILIAFIAACILLGLTPGPNMSLILANTLRSGCSAGLVTLAGTTTGLALLVAAAAAGHELR